MSRQQQETQNTIRCQITFKKPANVSEFTSEMQEDTIMALAEILHCSREDMRLVDVRQDRVMLTLDMPEQAFEGFMKLGQADEPAFKELGISQGREILEEYYEIENIRFMLSKMFTVQEFRVFCQKHFATVSDKISSETNKSVMIETLVGYARQTSRIPHILTFTNQHNSKIYEKYAPYYKPVRSFPSREQEERQRRSFQSRPKPRFFNLTLKEFAQSVILGLGVATGITFLLQRVIMTPVDENIADLMYFLHGGKALLGILVAEVVLKSARFKRGKFLAAISVSCYWLGYILGTALVFISTEGAPVLWGLLMGFGMAISSFIPPSAITIAMIIGTYLAYKYAR